MDLSHWDWDSLIANGINSFKTRPCSRSITHFVGLRDVQKSFDYLGLLAL